MWLFDSFDEVDMKLHKGMVKAKRKIIDSSTQSMRNKATQNAAGQTSIKADLISEKTFLSTLQNEGVNGVLYSEESGTIKFGRPKENDKNSVSIILDPLDGSQNYVKGLPIGCMSVAYGYYKEEPRLEDLNRSLVLNLYRDDLLSSKKNSGSYYNGKKLILKERIRSNGVGPLIISYYYYSKMLKQKENKITTKYSTRSLGSSAWELALVALGQSDAYIDVRDVLKAHDFCGVKLVLEEMGGKFSFLSYSKYKDQNQIPLDDFSAGYSVVAGIDVDLVDQLYGEIKGIVKLKT